jgi:protein-S-isoprenylcysteine O-methyltransferase Ste14
MAENDPAGRDLDPPAVPFLDRRSHPRPRIESAFVRVVATCGIVGICVAVAAILGTQNVAAWIIGLAISVASVVLAALLWSSRTL